MNGQKHFILVGADTQLCMGKCRRPPRAVLRCTGHMSPALPGATDPTQALWEARG